MDKNYVCIVGDGDELMIAIGSDGLHAVHKTWVDT